MEHHLQTLVWALAMMWTLGGATGSDTILPQRDRQLVNVEQRETLQWGRTIPEVQAPLFTPKSMTTKPQDETQPGRAEAEELWLEHFLLKDFP